MDWKEFLRDTYFNPINKGAFRGPDKLKQILKQQGYNVSYNKVREWLQDQDAYSLHQPTQYRFKRDCVITKGIDDIWDMDLADVSSITKYNDKQNYWLILIDIFSKYLWVEPISDKSHESVITALQNIFERTDRRSTNIRSDNGAEFKNRWVKKYLKKNNIHSYTAKNETKANHVERVIRTLKTMVYRYFSHKETYKYTDILQDLVSNYNNSPHTTLRGRAPIDVTKHKEAHIWKEMYIDTIKKNFQIQNNLN